MKKLVAIVELFVFVVTSIRVVISIHWCGGKLVAVYFYSLNEKKCKCVKKKMKLSCCKDKTVCLKVNDPLSKPNKFLSFNPPSTPFEIPVYIQSSWVKPQDEFSYLYFHPPCKNKIPVYLSNRVLII